MDTCDSAMEANAISVVDDTATRANRMTVVDIIAGGTPVVNGIATEANGTTVVDGAATEATRIAIASQIQQPRNPWKSFKRFMFKVGMLVCLSGVTELVNRSGKDIEFYFTANSLEELEFSLSAIDSKLIRMRTFFSYERVNISKKVELKVQGKATYEKINFIPEDFVIFKKLVFDVNDEGEIFLFHSEKRWPDRSR